MASRLAGGLSFSIAEHGWTLDIGSFLAAWATAIRGMVDARTDEARLKFARFARLYAFNVVQRLASHNIKIDPKTFEPRSLNEISSVLREVAGRIQCAASDAHVAFLFLGDAATSVQLGLKPGMPSNYYRQLKESAMSSVERIHGVFPGHVEFRSETIWIELIRLGGNVDTLKRILSASSLNRSRAEYQVLEPDAHEQKHASVVCEMALPELIEDMAI